MKKIKIKAERASEIATGIGILGDCESLEFATAYRLLKIRNAVVKVVKSYNSQREAILREYTEKYKDSYPKMSEEEKKKVDGEMNEKLKALLEKEYEIEIPELKMDMFVAKDNKNVFYRTIKDGEVEYSSRYIQKGEIIAPINFFTLLGEEIIEDNIKNTEA